MKVSMHDEDLRFQRIGQHTLPVPQQAKAGDAGYDLAWPGITRAETECLLIQPGDRVVIPTGWAVAIPTGWVGLICERSGLGARGLAIRGGVVDSGYRGEIAVIVEWGGEEPLRVLPGDRIAQLVVIPCLHKPPVEVSDLDKTERGENGFGSTGT